jgi:hypothetical protein
VTSSARPRMTATWSPHELQCIDTARELYIAVKRADGTLRRWTPIWVVCAGNQVYVRTWYRRDTGWFGHALRSRRARVRVPGLEADVTIEDVGEGTAELRESIDTAYGTKYGSAGSTSMVTASAATTTLRLIPSQKLPAAEISELA